MLGFNLMGLLASKITGKLLARCIGKQLAAVKNTGSTVGTPQHKACCLGRKLLLKTFKVVVAHNFIELNYAIP